MTTDPILFPCPCPWCKKIPNSGTRNDLYNGQGFVLCENWECPVNPEYTDTCLSLAIANWNRCADPTPKPMQGDLAEAVKFFQDVLDGGTDPIFSEAIDFSIRENLKTLINHATQPAPIVWELKEIIEEIKQALAALDAEENSVKQNNQSNEGG